MEFNEEEIDELNSSMSPPGIMDNDRTMSKSNSDKESPLFNTPPIVAEGVKIASPTQGQLCFDSSIPINEASPFDEDGSNDFSSEGEQEDIQTTIPPMEVGHSITPAPINNFEPIKKTLVPVEPLPAGGLVVPTAHIPEMPIDCFPSNSPTLFKVTHSPITSTMSPSYDIHATDLSIVPLGGYGIDDSDARGQINEQTTSDDGISAPKFVRRPSPTADVAHSLDNPNNWFITNFRHSKIQGKSSAENNLVNSSGQVTIYPSKTAFKLCGRHHNHSKTLKKDSSTIGGKKVCSYGRRYVEGEHIGEGSYAEVIEAYDTVVRRVVAIKVNKVPLIKSSLDKEMRVLDELTRDKSNNTITNNIVSLMDHWINEDKTKEYIVITYTQYGTLKTLLEKAPEHKLPLKQARDLFRCLINGLSYIHSKGIFHRDIKADNLLILNESSLLITDFGTATKKTQSKGGGAPGYQPPELAKTGTAPSTAKQDIWAAGITLYIMVIGHFPFELGPLTKIYEDISRCEFNFYEDTLPGDLVNLLKGVLDPDPDTRMTLKEILESPWMTSEEYDNDGKADFVIPTRIRTAFNEDFISKILITFGTGQ